MNFKNKISNSVNYWLLIFIITGITIVAYINASNMIVTSRNSAEIINIAGRQRMFSQQIASFAAQYAHGYVASNTSLVKAITNFETNTKVLHQKLDIQKNAIKGDFDPPVYKDSLVVNINHFIASARRVSQLSMNDPQLEVEMTSLFSQANNVLLNELDQLVLSEQRFTENQQDSIARIQMILFIFILAMLVVGAFVIVRPLELTTSKLRTLTEIDMLTGAYSRRMFVERTSAEFDYAKKNGKSFSILMIDVDHFKSINDIFGHAGGDVALSSLVTHISHLLNSSDFIGRLGGEEFAVVLPETSVINAIEVAERIRRSVDNLLVPYGSRFIKVTISIGVASLSKDADNVSNLMKLADKALYIAKTEGRNRVIANK